MRYFQRLRHLDLFSVIESKRKNWEKLFFSIFFYRPLNLKLLFSLSRLTDNNFFFLTIFQYKNNRICGTTKNFERFFCQHCPHMFKSRVYTSPLNLFSSLEKSSLPLYWIQSVSYTHLTLPTIYSV